LLPSPSSSWPWGCFLVFELAAGTLSPEEAWRSIHYETILLLFGMMIVVANLRIAGFFPIVARWFVRRANAPQTLLPSSSLSPPFCPPCSSMTPICIVMTPVALEITRSLGRRPLPYLLAVNPQNMMIGGFSGIPYATFFFQLAPVALFGICLTFLILRWRHRDEFSDQARVETPEQPIAFDRTLLAKSLTAALLMFAALFLGAPIAVSAMAAGAALLITRRVHPEERNSSP